MLVLFHPQHPLAQEQNKKSLRIHEILLYPLILPAEGNDNDVRQIFQDHRNKMKLRFVLRDDKSIISMIEKNFGITVMPELAMRGYTHTLQMLPLDPRSYRTIGIASRSKDSISIITRTFIDWVQLQSFVHTQ